MSDKNLPALRPPGPAELPRNDRGSISTGIQALLEQGDCQTLLRLLAHIHLADLEAQRATDRPQGWWQRVFGRPAGVMSDAQDTLRELTKITNEMSQLFGALERYDNSRTRLALARQHQDYQKALIEAETAATRLNQERLEIKHEELAEDRVVRQAERLVRLADATRRRTQHEVATKALRDRRQVEAREQQIDRLSRTTVALEEELAAERQRTTRFQRRLQQLNRRVAGEERRRQVHEAQRERQASALEQKREKRELAKIDAEIAGYQRQQRAAATPIIPEDDMVFIRSFLDSRKKGDRLQGLDAYLQRIAAEHGEESTEYENAVIVISDLRGRLVDSEDAT